MSIQNPMDKEGNWFSLTKRYAAAEWGRALGEAHEPKHGFQVGVGGWAAVLVAWHWGVSRNVRLWAHKLVNQVNQGNRSPFQGAILAVQKREKFSGVGQGGWTPQEPCDTLGNLHIYRTLTIWSVLWLMEGPGEKKEGMQGAVDTVIHLKYYQK